MKGLVAVVIALSSVACIAQGPGPVGPQPVAGATAASPSSTESAEPAAAETSGGIAGALVRDQLIKVRGMTVEEAKAYLKSLGHDGEVSLSSYTVYKNCDEGKVCDVEPEAGTGVHDRITLHLNAAYAK